MKYFVQIENYSNMLLSDARADFDHCTNKEENVRRFEKLSDIQPQSRDQSGTLEVKMLLTPAL